MPQPTSQAAPAGSLPTSQLPCDPAGPAAWSAPGPLGASPPVPRVDRRGGYCPHGVFYRLLNPQWLCAKQYEPVLKTVVGEDVEQLLTSNKLSENAVASLNE